MDTQYDELDCLLRKLLSLRLAKDNQVQAGKGVFVIHNIQMSIKYKYKYKYKDKYRARLGRGVYYS